MSVEVRFKVDERDEYTVVEVELPGVVTPDVLRGLQPPQVNPRKGVVLSGRAPVWLYAFLAHHYHPTLFVATFDPRIGAVVVQSHTPKYRAGDILQI